MEKIKSIVYAVGMTTVAAIALFCTVKFAMLVHKTEKFVDNLIETGNEVKEIIDKENKQLSDKNETDKGTGGLDSKTAKEDGLISNFLVTTRNARITSENTAIITSGFKNLLFEKIPDKKGDPKPNTTVTPDKQESEPKTRIVQFKEDLDRIHEILPKIQEVTERTNRTVESFGFDRRSDAEVAADEKKRAAEKVASKGEPGNIQKFWDWLMTKNDGTRFDDSGIFKRVSDYLWSKCADTRNDAAEAEAAQETDNGNSQNNGSASADNNQQAAESNNGSNLAGSNDQQAAESNDGDNSDSVKNEKLMCGIQ